jgi:tetratricopeptide (TPR) repeat protein
MRRVHPSDKPVTPPPPAARRGRWVWVAAAGAVVVLAVGGWPLVRERARAAADRSAALAAAHDQRPDAGERLTACLARDPDDTEVLETLVVWSLRGGAPFAQFEAHLDRLCELKPADPAPWRTRATQRIRAGRVAEGIADGLRALELDPGDSDTLELVATYALEAGDPALAVRELGRRLDFPPRPPDDVAALLVRAHLQAGDGGRAEQALDRYFPATRTDAQARLLRGLVHQAAGRHTDAVPLLRAAGQSSEHRSAALSALAKSLSALGREEDARKVLDELDAAQARARVVLDAAQRPDDLAAQVRAAEVHLADGKPAEAVGVLERATAALGRSPEATAVLARAYRQLGREDLARRCEQAGP